MVFPWIQFIWLSNKLIMEDDSDSLSDIQFLAVKEFEGKLRQADGTVTATGDVASLTANTGKDMYLASAKCNVKDDQSVNGASCTVVLKVNAVIVDTYHFLTPAVSSSTGYAALATNYDFPVGFKVDAGQIIKIEVTAESSCSINAEIQCFEETDGVSPRLGAQTSGTATITGGIAGSLGFISKKAFQGKTRQNDGILTTTGTLATLTANSGKDMYLASAKCSLMQDDDTGTINNAQIDLTVNGTIVESYVFYTAHGTGRGHSGTGPYEFTWKGFVDATQVIKLEVATLSTAFTVAGHIQCWEETDGVDPTA